MQHYIKPYSNTDLPSCAALFCVIGIALALTACTKPAPNPPAQTEVLPSPAEVISSQPEEIPAPSVPAVSQEAATPAIKNPSVREFDFAAARIAPVHAIDEELHILNGGVRECSELYPVGFSRDGAFACFEANARDGRGDTVVCFCVQDLISDKILFSLQSDNEHDEYYYTENYRNGDILSYFAAQNYEQIDDALALYNISIAHCAFEKLPYKNGAEFLDARISVTAVREDEMGFTERDYDCIAINALGAEKTVERHMNLRGGTAYVCGYLKNPYENRLALIIAEEQFGFEGFDVLYHIVGCDMESGF